MKKPLPPKPHLEGVRPESQMMSFGYTPEWSEGAIKPPIFLTSTFAFRTAEEGKEYFSYAYGLSERDPSRPMGLIYSRLNNPDIEILEGRLNLWDQAEESAVFASGMAAISTTILALVPLGHSVLFARPVYGGSDYLLEHLLPERGIVTRQFAAGARPEKVEEICRELEKAGTPCRMIFFETPANPTLVMTDIAEISKVAHEFGALCAVDNTLLGPVYQQPLEHGADLVLYSATKYLGGHSDVVAGVALGSHELIEAVKLYRTILGSMLDPHSAWMLLRSLETAKLRMTCSRKNAERIAAWLSQHPLVTRVLYPGADCSERQVEIFGKQCSGAGALMSFEIKGGEKEAFQMLNAVRLIKLAVSLGGTESLIEHPSTMTHADVPPDEQLTIGITPSMIRLAVGIEHPDDLIADLAQALDRVGGEVELSLDNKGGRDRRWIVINMRNILVPLDFSTESAPGLELGIEICRQFDAKLVLEHNFDPRPPNFLSVTWMWSEEKEEGEREKQDTAQRKLREVLRSIPPGIRVEGKLTRGPVDEALLVLARQLPADLMIMACHGPSSSEHQSLTEKVIVEAPCPVLTVPQGQESSRLLAGDPGEVGLPVVVPVDFSEHSLAGLRQAFDLAQRLPFHLHLFYVEPRDRDEGVLSEDLEKLRGLVPEWLRERVETHVGAGEPRDEIVALAEREGAVAIVMGTHAKGGIRRLFKAAHCHELLHASRCPVWFVPPGAAADSATA